VVIKNTAPDMVDGVEIIVHLQDGYGKDIDTVKKEVGRVEGSADYTFEFTWQITTLSISTLWPRSRATGITARKTGSRWRRTRKISQRTRKGQHHKPGDYRCPNLSHPGRIIGADPHTHLDLSSGVLTLQIGYE